MTLAKDLETVKTIARMAASVCVNIQSELVAGAEKAGREPVTIADYASQGVIGNGLAENFPDDGVLSEERSEEFMLLLSDEQRGQVSRFITDALGGYVFEEQICAWLDFGKQKESERLWVVDPIDGTKGFLGQRHYCIAIALLVNREPVLGVLASPGYYSDLDTERDDPGVLTYALKGEGAFQEPLFGGSKEAVQVSSVSDPRVARLLTSYESKHTDMSFFNAVAENLGRDDEAPQIGLDSQDKHAMVAAGHGEVYLRIVPEENFREKLWDHAAGYAVVTEAGGRMTDIHGAPIDWASGTRMANNRGVLVTNGHLHDALLDAIAKTGFK